MAAFRAILLLSSVVLSAAVGDLQSLVQKNVGVHAPDEAAVNLFRGAVEEGEGLEEAEGLEDSLEAPPAAVLKRLPMEMVSTAKATVTNIWTLLQRFLNTVQAPLFEVLGVNGTAVLKQRKPEELMELFTGYLVAFGDSGFPAHVNATIKKMSGAVGALGDYMVVAALGLMRRRAGGKSGAEEQAATDMEQATYNATHAIAVAATSYFEAMKNGTQHLPTRFLENATLDLKSWLNDTASSFDAEKVFKERVRPIIKSLFAPDAVCREMQQKLPAIGEGEASLRAEASAAVAGIRGVLPELDYFAAVVARRRSQRVLDHIPQALASFNYFLDSMDHSIHKFMGGLHILNKAMAEVAERDLHCKIL